MNEDFLDEKKLTGCRKKVAQRYKTKPYGKNRWSAYASGALVQCRKRGAKNWGNSKKKNESTEKNKEKIMKKEQLRNVIREMVINELKCWPGHKRVPGTKSGEKGSCRKVEEVAVDKNTEGSIIYSDDKYEMYRTSDSYDVEPRLGTRQDYSTLDDFTFSIRNKATKKDIHIARGEFKSPSFFLIFDVNERPIPTPKELIDFLRKFIDNPKLGEEALRDFLADDRPTKPSLLSPELDDYLEAFSSKTYKEVGQDTGTYELSRPQLAKDKYSKQRKLYRINFGKDEQGKITAYDVDGARDPITLPLPTDKIFNDETEILQALGYKKSSSKSLSESMNTYIKNEQETAMKKQQLRRLLS